MPLPPFLCPERIHPVRKLITFLLLSATVFAAPSGLSLHIRPVAQVVAKTGNVSVITTLSPNPHNRLLCVAVDGPTYRSSCRELDAERAPVTAEWRFGGLEPGEYVAEARVGRDDGTVKDLTAPFRVIGLGSGAEP